MKLPQLILPALAALFLCSCASYVTPGRQADLSTFTDPRVKKAFVARPAIKFPANLAVVRIQESGYRSESAQGVGSGAYSVVTTRDIETEQDIDTISKLQGVAGVVTLNRLLLPKTLSSDLDLRESAAKLQAEAILIYTLATEFSDNEIIAPLTTLTLGLAPNKQYKIHSTASAILMDTKTGYIYGALEEGDSRSGLTIAWGSSNAIDAARKKAERAAYDKLLASFTPFLESHLQPLSLTAETASHALSHDRDNEETYMKRSPAKKELSQKQRDELFKTLKARFEKNMNRHEGIEWAKVQAKLEANEGRLWSLNEMETTGGEPDVVGHDKKTGEYVFYDCSPESPKGRVSVCYDREGLESRKEHRPKTTAIDMATEMGIELLTEEQYLELQKLGSFDTKTSSWLKTPEEMRKLGGALFGDRRFGRVFFYHNGAQSYYSARGFRGWLRV